MAQITAGLPVWVLLANFTNKQSSHSRSGTSTKGMCKLEALKTVAALSLLSHDIQHRVYEFCTLSVVTLGPVISSTTLTENKVF